MMLPRRFAVAEVGEVYFYSEAVHNITEPGTHVGFGEAENKLAVAAYGPEDFNFGAHANFCPKVQRFVNCIGGCRHFIKIEVVQAGVIAVPVLARGT